MPKERFLQLIEELQSKYSVDFAHNPYKEVSGQIRALEESRRKNAELIQEHFEEIIMLIEHKRPCVEMLATMNQEIGQKITVLKERQLVQTKGAAV